MGGKLDRMRDAIREKALAKLHAVEAVVEPDGKLRVAENSVPVEPACGAAAVSQLAAIGTEPNPLRKAPPRLPHGSSFSFVYTSQDADRGFWEGVLTIPVPDGEPLTFRYRAGAVMRMFPRLDQFYRRHLRRVEADRNNSG